MSDDEWTSPSKAPRPLSEVLGKVLRKMKVSDETTALGLFSHWREIVGDPIADHVLPKRLEKRRLVVEVDDAAWATQLKFLVTHFLHTLNDHFRNDRDSLGIPVRIFR